MCFFKCDVEPSCNWWTNKNQRQWKLLFFSSRNLELTLDCVMLVKPYKKLWNRTKLNLMERLTKVWSPRASKNMFVCCCCCCCFICQCGISKHYFRQTDFQHQCGNVFGFSPWFLTSYSSTFQRGILSRQTLELPYPLNPRQFKFWEKIAAVVNLQKLSTLKPKQESTSVRKNLYIRCLNLSLFLSSRSRILWFRNQIMIVWST